jgi:hypothetical protein
MVDKEAAALAAMKKDGRDSAALRSFIEGFKMQATEIKQLGSYDARQYQDQLVSSKPLITSVST